jgi:hypothetical protein
MSLNAQDLDCPPLPVLQYTSEKYESKRPWIFCGQGGESILNQHLREMKFNKFRFGLCIRSLHGNGMLRKNKEINRSI